MTDLTGKIIFITGASSGIGEACAKLLAAHGTRLILTARRSLRLEALAKDLYETYQTDCLIKTLDIRDKTAVESVINTLPDNWQPIDVLINNAGLALSTNPLQSGHFNDWETMIDTNIKGLLYVTRTILPSMVNRKCGHIVNIGSIAGQEHYQNGNVYSATKHAVRAITKSLRLDLLGTKVRVTEIAPGAVETEFSTVRWNDAEKARLFYSDFTPLSANDIADAVYYCISRPAHVDIAEMTIMPTAQATLSMIDRSGR